jgi:hypothetical protein
MYNERLDRLEKLYVEEFPVLVKEYYKEFSEKYTYRYKPLSSIDTGNGKVDLFTFIENYFKDNYKIPYKIDKHFELHSNCIFYAPTDEFGFSMSIKNADELPKVIKDECLNEYGFLNDFGIFAQSLYGTSNLSNIIKNKIKEDLELECELIKQRMKSKLKRFFIQGQVNWNWIVADQIYHYGIDKFPNCLDHEFSQLLYSAGFYEKYLSSLVGDYPVGGNYTIRSRYLDKKIKTLEDNFYSKLKAKKVTDYTYLDVIEKHLLNIRTNEIASTYITETENINNISIKAKCNILGEIPVLELRDYYNFINEKLDFEHIYFNYLKLQCVRPTIETDPFVFPINFKLDIKDVFNDETLIHEYLETYNEPENEIRKLFGLPKIGEGWISETNLFYEIKTHFSKHVVIHHGRPSWLGKQHLDIYIPKFNIGIEYQGDQHYYPIDFFGGEDSYVKNKARDENKKQLCIKNNCHLIYVNPGYTLDEVITRIEKIIGNN